MGYKNMAVETDPAWIENVVVFFATVGTILGFQYKAAKGHRYRMERIEAETANAKKDAAAAMARSEAAHAALTECRLGVEQEFASKGGLKDVEARITDAIKDLTAEFRNYRDRDHG